MLQYPKLIADRFAVGLLAAIVWPHCSAKAETHEDRRGNKGCPI